MFHEEASYIHTVFNCKAVAKCSCLMDATSTGPAWSVRVTGCNFQRERERERERESLHDIFLVNSLASLALLKAFFLFHPGCRCSTAQSSYAEVEVKHFCQRTFMKSNCTAGKLDTQILRGHEDEEEERRRKIKKVVGAGNILNYLQGAFEKLSKSFHFQLTQQLSWVQGSGKRFNGSSGETECILKFVLSTSALMFKKRNTTAQLHLTFH